jgi:ketosteroid isomerase-like protein
MKTQKRAKLQLVILLILSMVITSCNEKASKNNLEANQPNLTSLEKEIELRLRDYENYLRNGDSIALGHMYTEDAEIIPSTVGRDNIINVFGNMIKGGTTGSSFKTTKLWGNDQLLVEEGTGTWYHTDGTPLGSGRYLLVWKKDEGTWKILRDTWFPDKKK